MSFSYHSCPARVPSREDGVLFAALKRTELLIIGPIQPDSPHRVFLVTLDQESGLSQKDAKEEEMRDKGQQVKAAANTCEQERESNGSKWHKFLSDLSFKSVFSAFCEGLPGKLAEGTYMYL